MLGGGLTEMTTPAMLYPRKHHQQTNKTTRWHCAVYFYLSPLAHTEPTEVVLVEEENETKAKRHSLELDTDPCYQGADAHVCFSRYFFF